MQLSCPVCNTPLAQVDKQLICANKHSFDIARQGYWNLLLANKKRSKDPGDNADMIAARSLFLNTGHYQPIAEQVTKGIVERAQASSKQHLNLADIGCGEGYYTDYIQKAVCASGIDLSTLGLDISKHAVKAACKRNKSIEWVVGSGSQIPVTAHTLDVISLMFCRLMPEALHKALKHNGLLLVAWPGQKHLIELRERIYTDVKTSTYNPTELLAEQFDLDTLDTLNFQITLNNNPEIAALLAMTPHSQRMPANERASLEDCEHLTLTVDVNLGWYRAK